MLGKIKKNWAKYLALGIVAIFLLLGAYLAIKPGWKEYKGDGFTIRYPPSWDLEEVVKEPVDLTGHFFEGWEVLLNISHTSILHEPNNHNEVFYVSDSLVRLFRIPKEKFSPKAAAKLTFGTGYSISSKNFVYHISSETAVARGVFYSLYYGLLGQIVVGSFQVVNGQ